MEKSAWEKYKEKNNLNQVKPWDVLNPNTEWTDEETSKIRFDLCKSCPELIKLTKQCKKCGCFMAVKTKLQMASCPIGKW
ncbi:MAG: DUF6171 family protein [bacterium]